MMAIFCAPRWVSPSRTADKNMIITALMAFSVLESAEGKRMMSGLKTVELDVPSGC